jgi:2-methylcitrate dehydratase PrpD
MGRIASTRPRGNNELSRRKVLGGLAAAAMLPGGANAADDDISPVMRKLAAYMAEAGGRAPPDKAAREAKYHILDTLAAMISGSELPPGQHALDFVRAYGGAPKVTVVATDILAGPLEAAIVNGAFAQADETDDNYSAGGAHPGCAIVPASLVMGELLGIDGLRFVRAVTLGYDIGMRAMKSVYRDNVLRDTHNIVGTFGASAAAGAIAGFDEQRMRWLLDYAAQQAGSGFGAWQRDTEHTEKAFLFGSAAARNGVTAALLIKTGWTGVNDVFSGHENFFQSYAPKSDPATLVDKLGERYEVTQTIIKKWSTGGPIQSPLDAVVNLRKEHPFKADDVKGITVHLSTSAAPKVDNVVSPDLCLQYLVAVLLLDGTVSFKAAHDKARMDEPAIQAQRRKVRVVAQEELERMLPRRVAVIEIALADGTVLKETNDTVRGTPENPMSEDEIVGKARDLIVPVLGADKGTALVEQVLNLERVKDVRELRPLLQKT